jgi:hypothetical protein
MESGGGWDWIQTLLLIASIGLLIYMAAKQTSETMKAMEAERVELYSVVACADGSIRNREFRNGDYVGGKADDCESGVVIGVYAKNPEREKRQKQR